MEGRMPSPSDDLRSTIEAIHDDAEEVQDLEEKKAELDPGDPRMVTLSDQVQRVATDLKDLATAERELSEEAQASG
jgi:methyl-accepting chemotaxis protein